MRSDRTATYYSNINSALQQNQVEHLRRKVSVEMDQKCKIAQVERVAGQLDRARPTGEEWLQHLVQHIAGFFRATQAIIEDLHTYNAASKPLEIPPEETTRTHCLASRHRQTSS
jgi:hypothetical protein